MKFTRPLILAASVVMLVVSACSQPADVETPGLEPQFGTKNDDIAANVLVDSAGNVSVLLKESGTKYFPETGTNSAFDKVLLRKYDNNGKLLRSTVLDAYDCSFADEIDESCDLDYSLKSLKEDAKGNIYAVYSGVVLDGYFSGRYAEHYVTKISAAGKIVSKTDVDVLYGVEDGSEEYGDVFGADVDANGNLYVISAQSEYFGYPRTSLVSKYSPSGVLLWQRTSKVGIPSSIAFNNRTADVYISGSKGVSALTDAGSAVSKRSEATTEVVFADFVNLRVPTLYTRNLTTIRAFDDYDKQLWSKTQTGLTGMVIASIKTDRSGNLYLAGKYTASSGNRDAFARKLDTSGKVLWTKTFGTSAYDDARDIATVTGAGIYITGETQGALAGKNLGGSDGYLRKLDSNGNPLWTR